MIRTCTCDETCASSIAALALKALHFRITCEAARWVYPNFEASCFVTPFQRSLSNNRQHSQHLQKFQTCTEQDRGIYLTILAFILLYAVLALQRLFIDNVIKGILPLLSYRLHS